MVREQTRFDVVVIPDRPARSARLVNLTALGCYIGLALAFFGPMILPHLSDRVLTTLPGDWGLFVWAFRWWPHTVAHGTYPLFTHDLWFPTGMNLAWTTIMPTPSFLLWPVTRVLGPVAAFNIASLLAPALTAWTAYLLFARLTRRAFAPSLAGGFVYGFSPYMLAQLTSGHLNLSLGLLIPLCAYLVVRLLQGDMHQWTFVVLMTVCLVLQFGISTEMFATMGLFAFLIGVVGFVVAPAERGHIVRAGGLIGLSFALAALLVAPYLWAAFTLPEPYKPLFDHPVGPILAHDLPRIFVPGAPEIFGRNFGQPGTNAWYFRLERFGWYVPLPLLAIVVHLWITERRRITVKMAVAVFALGMLLALGPAISVHGVNVRLPWSLIQVLPLIKRAFPYRMMAYATLGLGACVAYWLASSPRSWRRWTVFALGGFLLLPNLTSGLWTRDVYTPAFFSTGEYRAQLRPGEVVWVIDTDGASQMLWQAETGMYFKLPGGFTGVTPLGLADTRTENRLVSGLILPGDGEAIRAFIDEHDVNAVVVGRESPEAIAEISAELRVPPVRTGGVLIFRI